MLRTRTKSAAFALLLSLSVVSCSDDAEEEIVVDGGSDSGTPTPGSDAGKDGGVVPNIDAATDAGVVPGTDADVVDANTGDAGNKALVACLEQPGLPRPPTGELPCELLPPGFSR